MNNYLKKIFFVVALCACTFSHMCASVWDAIYNRKTKAEIENLLTIENAKEIRDNCCLLHALIDCSAQTNPTYDRAITTLLLQYQTPLDIYCPKRGTPLNWAISMNNPEIAKLLIEAGASLNFDWDKDPLEIAIMHNNDQIAELLLEHGAIPYNDFLRIATEHNHPDMVRLLLCYGADPKARLYKNKLTVLEIAQQMGRKSIVKLITQYQKNPQSFTAQAKSANRAPQQPRPGNNAQSQATSNSQTQPDLTTTSHNGTQQNSVNNTPQGTSHIHQPTPPPINNSQPTGNGSSSTTRYTKTPHSQSSYFPQGMRTKPFLLAATLIADLVCMKYTYDDWNATQKKILKDLLQEDDTLSFSEKVTLYFKHIFSDPLDHQAFFALLLSLGGTGYALFKG